MTVLVVAALAEETAALPPDVDVLELGVGKLSAATRLAAHLHVHADVDLVLNVGTAGGLRDQPHNLPVATVLEVGRVIQHDLDVDGIAHLVGRELPGGPIDLVDDGVTLATGDRFITDPVARAALAGRADLVDMEGYAVVATCRAFHVPVRVVKCISDGADGESAMTWKQAVATCAAALADHLAQAGLITGS